jgi:septal ring factor EnvC (AmiA/AmiB activator)
MTTALQKVEAADAAKAIEDLKVSEASVQKSLQDDIASWQEKFHVLSEQHSKCQAELTAQLQELQRQNRNYDEELKIAFNKHIEDGNRIKLLEREVKGTARTLDVMMMLCKAYSALSTWPPWQCILELTSADSHYVLPDCLNVSLLSCAAILIMPAFFALHTAMDKEKSRVKSEVDSLQAQLLSVQADHDAAMQHHSVKLASSNEEVAAVTLRLQETESLHVAAQETIAQLHVAQV